MAWELCRPADPVQKLPLTQMFVRCDTQSYMLRPETFSMEALFPSQGGYDPEDLLAKRVRCLSCRRLIGSGGRFGDWCNANEAFVFQMIGCIALTKLGPKMADGEGYGLPH